MEIIENIPAPINTPFEHFLMLFPPQKIPDKRDALLKEEIKNILFENTLNEINPVVIYRGTKPIFWNHSMEKITGYTFAEIQEMSRNGVDIMELFYSYSEHEIERVRESVNTVLETKQWYEERVFTLKNREGHLVRIAWHNEAGGSDISIRKGSIDLARKLKMMVESGSTIEDLMTELMRQKDEYTSGHINRVMYLSVKIAEIFGYDEKKLWQLKIMAGLHDIGKTKVDDSVLKKPVGLTSEERKSMECHAGNGVYQGVKNGYGELIRWMPHHSDFSSSKWNPELSFEDLVERIKLKEDINPILFNHLVGNNIPEEARIISIADSVDAIVSRRIYSKFLTHPIEEIVTYLEWELLRSSALVLENNVIKLDPLKWRCITLDELALPQRITWWDLSYVPSSQVVRIQFDPRIVIKIYENGKIKEHIKQIIKENDNTLIPKKIIEIEQYLFDFEQKLTDEKESWTQTDEETYMRLRDAKASLEKLFL